jgi:hypothetical protein
MVMDESKPKTEDINCPFLKMVAPDNSNFLKCVSSTSAAGFSYQAAALLVSFDNISKQKGTWKALAGHALDLYALNQVGGVSHPDKYNRSKDLKTQTLTGAADAEGIVTMQDSVDLKKKIEAEENIETIMEWSLARRRLLFCSSEPVATWSWNRQGCRRSHLSFGKET